MTQRLVSAAQARWIDRVTQERYAIPGTVLMEHAGRAVAEHARRMLSRRRARVVVVCGTGNNGGDGLVAARYLHNAGRKVQVYLVGGIRRLRHDARRNFLRCVYAGVPLRVVGADSDLAALSAELSRAGLVIDALFGIGLSRPVTGLASQVIAAINRHARSVLAVDVPSGLDPDTGAARGMCVQAAVTVTMGLVKKGMRRAGARRYVGSVIVADIGYPRDIERELST